MGYNVAGGCVKKRPTPILILFFGIFLFFKLILFFFFYIVLLYIYIYIVYIIGNGSFANVDTSVLYYFMDFKDIKGTRHYLYDNLEEFKALVPNTVVVYAWRDGEEGDWIVTDDNCVCQVLKKSKIGKDICIRTLCGTYSVTTSSKLLGEKGIVDNIYSFSGKNSLDTGKISGRQKLFAQYVAKGDNAIDAYRKAHPEAKSESYIKHRTNSLLKTESIQKMIKKEIQECLASEGVTPEWIIGRYKTIVDVADRESDCLRALESLTKIAGLFDAQDTKSEQLTVWAGFSPEQLEALNGTKKLVAHAEKETEAV